MSNAPSNVKWSYRSLADFVISRPLTIDVELDDGFGAMYPVKGCELDAAIVFADISGYSTRASQLSGTEALILVNNFLAWITAESIRHFPCIVDKYIGDEVMLVFSQEFGSEDPLADALRASRALCDNDFLAFHPHVGVAAGRVTIGFTGTPIHYSCSAFGAPVNLAARCAGHRPADAPSGTIVTPAADWGNREAAAIFPPTRFADSQGRSQEQPSAWSVRAARTVELKGLGAVDIVECVKESFAVPALSAENRARLALRQATEAGLYRPRT